VTHPLFGVESAAAHEPRRTRVKICCMGSRAEAELAIRLGADAIGLVSAMPSGPGVIDDDLIEEIARAVPSRVATFLLTCETGAEAIAAQVRRAGVSTVQLVDRIEPDGRRRLRDLLPHVALVQVIHVTGEESIDEAIDVAAEVDGILLDSGNPALAVKELGGTGRRHDWRISRRIRDAIEVPLFLAGGLNASNIAEAIDTVRPFGVDVCSGVRTAGRLDEAKLSAFLAGIADSTSG
jgi:phosphoribosylanthranilate isomerase